MSSTVLVIDDDPACRRLATAIFSSEGLSVVGAEEGGAGIEAARNLNPSVVLLDLEMPGMDGLAVLGRLQQVAPALPVIMLTADHDVRSAVRATKLGAYDYLTKPIDQEHLIAVVRRALERSLLCAEVEDLRKRLGAGGGLVEQMGTSFEVRQVSEQVAAVAASDLTVLVVGETGTGKELVAHAVHRQSSRRNRPFIALDCGAIPDALLESELFGHERGAFTGAEKKRIGRFELARGGTLFLDEIGNLPLGLQAKLLRVLESRQLLAVGGSQPTDMDVRFVAATNDDLAARVASGAFRADLYYRLAQYTIALPPLRQRPADVPYLALRFLEEASVELRRPVREIASDALELLERHAWPGNARELRNVVRQAVVGCHDLVLGKAHLRGMVQDSKRSTRSSAPASATSSLKEIADAAASAAEKQAIIETLHAAQGNKSRAARMLQTDYKTLHLKMRRFGLRGGDYQP